MNTGPKPGAGRPAGSVSFLDKLAARLAQLDLDGPGDVDWLIELAALADKIGLARAGQKLGYSAATVSQVLSGNYRGDLDRVEQCVRGALMGSIVRCPVLGEIGRDRCLDEQKQPFRATSAMRAQLFHACKSCPHARRQGGDHAE